MTLKVSAALAVGSSMKIGHRVLLGVAAVAALAGAVACGPAHPPPASDATADPDSDKTSDVTNFDLPPPKPRARVCEPLSSRPCKIDLGPTACPWTVQFCRPDGYDWYPCGQYDFDASAWSTDAGTTETEDAGPDDPVENIPPTVDVH